MIDTNTGSILTKSLEDSLNRIFTLKKDEINILDLQGIQTIVNRICPDCKCINVFYDNSLNKGVSAIPTYEEIDNIGRFLFNFENKDYKYSPMNYILNISPNVDKSFVPGVVAQILAAIDNMRCPYKFKEVKANILQKAIQDGMISDKVFTFKNGASYNITATPLILPFIINVIECHKTYFRPCDILQNVFFENDLQDNSRSLLVQYGYASYYIPDVSNDPNKAVAEYMMYFNSMWSNLMDYPANKGKIISMYNRVLDDNTSGTYEKNLALKAKTVLERNNNAVFDSQLAEYNLQESVKSFFETKKKGYSYLELDELRVEMEAMSLSDPTDKMYLITRIHKDLNTAIKAKKKASDYESTEIDKYIAELKDILKTVQDKKVKESRDDIRIIVQYPKNDYEND